MHEESSCQNQTVGSLNVEKARSCLKELEYERDYLLARVAKIQEKLTFIKLTPGAEGIVDKFLE